NAVTAATGAAGLPKLQDHQKSFGPPPVFRPGNKALPGTLKRSGPAFDVPAEASIPETMMTSPHTPKFYSGRGQCGICTMNVVSTDSPIEHRDHTLKPDERGSRICICVSRIKSGTLVLDA